MKKFAIAVIGLSVLMVLGFVWYVSQPVPEKKDLTALAQCLADKEVTMYGAYWCAHCRKQKTEFGASFKYINYVECTTNTKQCLEASVSGYPTWTFPDGKRLEGEQSLKKLAETAGCEFNQ